MAEVELTSKNFDKFISSGIPTLIDFWAPWCGPCQMMLPIIEELTNNAKEYQIGKVDIDDNSNLASRFNVMSVPTFLIFKKGEVVDQINGVTSKETLEQAIEKAKK